MQLIKNPYKLIDFYILVETINYTFTIYRLIPLNIFETYSLFLKNFYYKLCLPINKVHPSQNLLILDAITSTQSVDTTRLIHNSRNSIPPQYHATYPTDKIRSSIPRSRRKEPR